MKNLTNVLCAIFLMTATIAMQNIGAKPVVTSDVNGQKSYGSTKESKEREVSATIVGSDGQEIKAYGNPKKHVKKPKEQEVTATVIGSNGEEIKAYGR